ncbi:hypothetical protein [Enterococcus sp. AZ007]|uniref:hypothetical protein n=1 Tax=Enterococcus sp. AZ007 TaxID=2774839 RepID=UPI003F29DFD8
MNEQEMRAKVLLQRDKIHELEKELQIKQNPTVKESLEKYIYYEKGVLNALFREAKIKGINLTGL